MKCIGGPYDGVEVNDSAGRGLNVPIRSDGPEGFFEKCWYDRVRTHGDDVWFHVCGEHCPWNTPKRIELLEGIRRAEASLLWLAGHPVSQDEQWLEELRIAGAARWRALDRYELAYGDLPKGVER